MSHEAGLFVLAHHPGPAWHPELPYQEQPGLMEHIGFMRSLDQRGLLVVGGPFGDSDEGEPVGMAVVRAGSLDEAKALAAEDPSLAAGLLSVRVRPWHPRMGSALAE